MQKSALKLAGNRNYFKPFAYPWAYDAFVQSEQMHWLWTEVPMMEDVKDFQLKLTDSERDFLTKILRFSRRAILTCQVPMSRRTCLSSLSRKSA